MIDRRRETRCPSAAPDGGSAASLWAATSDGYPIGHRGPHVLLLAGEAADRDALEAALGAPGAPSCTLLSVADAAAARDAVRRMPIDCAVLAGELSPLGARALVTDLRAAAADAALGAIAVVGGSEGAAGPMALASLDGHEPSETGVDIILRDELTPALLRRALAYALDRRRFARQRDRLVQQDALTGLPNRAMLRAALGREAARARRGHHPFALLIVGLDQFRGVNDTLGHDIGDLLLKTVGTRIRRVVRADDLVARLGGDEYAVLARYEGDGAAIGTLADRVVQVLSEPCMLAGHPCLVGASIGISLCPQDGHAVYALMKHADLALDRAKADGGGVVRFFDESLNADLQDRCELGMALPGALDHGEFDLHYQPRVEPATGRLTGAEALLRWHHPVRGAVPPVDFIPIAEATRLIVPIGEWVLRRACEACQDWRQRGLSDLGVAVNVSPVQLRDGGLVQTVCSVLAETGLDPTALELEITESAAMSDVAEVARALAALAGHGVRIAIDDFGAGYSSLSRLQYLPVHRLKIDRSIVQLLEGNARQAPIVDAVMALGRHLGLSVVGEGVETETALNYLRRTGCDEVQGFHVCRPLPGDDFLAWANARRYGDTRYGDIMLNSTN